MFDMNSVWRIALDNIAANGSDVAPAGKRTLEMQHYPVQLNMRHPVLNCPERALGYRFMAAEAFWILTGDNRVESIAPYSKRIASFSDDSETFFGAYGPKIMEQMPYVVNTLIEDPFSRRAVINIWRENPEPTKDYPCTVAMTFLIRDGLLNAHVFMRSNDIWLGMPYDCFNFSMIAHLVCSYLNEQFEQVLVSPGYLYMTAASSHLYEVNWQTAKAIRLEGTFLPTLPTPEELFASPATLINELRKLREPGAARWWVGNAR